MTKDFGRRNRATALAKTARAAPLAELTLTEAQRALLFARAEAAEAAPAAADAPRPRRRAGLIACAAVTAVAVALGSLGPRDAALVGLPAAMEPMARQSLSLIGAAAAPLALAWTLAATFANQAANLWLTQKCAGAFGLKGFAAFAATGAALGFVMAWLSETLGLGASDLGLGAEALAGAAVAGLYWRLSGAARL